MIPITTLLQAVTPAQVRTTFVTALVGLGIPANQWKKGGVASSILTVVSTTYAGFSQTMVAALSAGFLPTATGAWLVLLAYYVYGVVAIAATQATGYVTLTNAGGGIYSYAAGACVFANPNGASGVQYTNVAPFTMLAATGAGPTTLSGLAIQANLAGTIGNADPGVITKIVTGMPLVTCTNPLSVVGQDAEPDAALRLRCTGALAARSVRGPRNAYQWAATSALTLAGVPVNVNRTTVSLGSSVGKVTVYVASPAGAPSASDVVAVAANIEAQVRPQTVTVTTLAAVPIAYAPSLTVWVQNAPGLNLAAVQTAIANALSAYIAAYPIGGVPTDYGTGLFGSGIAGVVSSAQTGTTVLAVETTGTNGLPPPDLALLPGQVATDGITLTVRAVTT